LDRHLTEHPRAKTSTAERSVRAKVAQLKLDAWSTVEVEGRSLKLRVNQPALDGISRLDGCYVLKTDLPQSAATKKVIHDRYKDLAEVEQAFRQCKTAHLEARPIYVHTADHTRGHVLVVMLAYLSRRDLSRAWTTLDVTIEEGLKSTPNDVRYRNQCGWGRQLSAHSYAQSLFARALESPPHPTAETAASHRNPCSHAEKTPRES
jgi:hypothetical protein